MPEIIYIGLFWPYDSKRCDNCIFLERSLPDEDGEISVACDYDGTCFVTGEVIYPELAKRKQYAQVVTRKTKTTS